MDEAVSDKDRSSASSPGGRCEPGKPRLARSHEPNVPEIDFSNQATTSSNGGGSNSGYLDDRSYTGPSERRVFADDHVIAIDQYRGR